MATSKINIMWKAFKGIRKLNSVNSASELGAEVVSNVSLSKEKSGQNRSIKSSGWFNDYKTLSDNVIKLFSANMSGYTYPDQLIAFTKTSTKIDVYIVRDNSGLLETPIKIAQFPLVTKVSDAKMIQFGDRLVVACAFNNNTLGFITYSNIALSGWTNISTNWYYRIENIIESTTGASVTNISSISEYGSRLAINGKTIYSASGGVESIYGVWFSEAGNPLNFNADYITSATDTSPFFVETGGFANKLVEYNGLTIFCQNKSYNVNGTTQNNIRVTPLTAKGVLGNGAFVVNGQCAYIDSYANNIFILTNQIDGTIGFDSPIGNEIQEFLSDVVDVSINSLGRKVRLLKSSGECLVYDIDISEWVAEKFNANSQCETFINEEFMADATKIIKKITQERQATSTQIPIDGGYYSYYKTNLIWLDSQTSIKSHIYPFAVILEPQTNNDFYIKFTTDRKQVYTARITRSGFSNIATYSDTDDVPANGSQFVEDDDDLSGRVFFSATGGDILVTIDRPPFWRYLQIEIYTTAATMEFNISGIEAKQTFISDELLDY